MTPTDAYAPEYPADCGPDERIGYVYVDGAECTPDEADNIGLHDLASAARSFASLRPDTTTPYEVATDRAEDGPCERGTVGCCVRHHGGESCETW
jgi:hypothetical protein